MWKDVRSLSKGKKSKSKGLKCNVCQRTLGTKFPHRVFEGGRTDRSTRLTSTHLLIDLFFCSLDAFFALFGFLRVLQIHNFVLISLKREGQGVFTHTQACHRIESASMKGYPIQDESCKILTAQPGYRISLYFFLAALVFSLYSFLLYLAIHHHQVMGSSSH